MIIPAGRFFITSNDLGIRFVGLKFPFWSEIWLIFVRLTRVTKRNHKISFCFMLISQRPSDFVVKVVHQEYSSSFLHLSNMYNSSRWSKPADDANILSRWLTGITMVSQHQALTAGALTHFHTIFNQHRWPVSTIRNTALLHLSCQ